MKNIKFIIFIIVLLSFAVGIYFYPLVPDKVPSHWNIEGELDGYMTKFWGLFLKERGRITFKQGIRHF